MAKPLKTEFAKKDGILHSAAFFLTIILMLLASYVIFSSSFVEFEKEKTLDNTHLALHTINDDLAFLSSSASYMASHAESVSMDANGIDIYNTIIKHLETDSVHDIDGVLIYDISSKSFVFNSESSGESSNIEAYIDSHPKIISRLLEETGISGMIFLPDRTLLLAMESFIPEDETEGYTSILIAYRELDPDTIGTIYGNSIFSASFVDRDVDQLVFDEAIIDTFAGPVFLDLSDNEGLAGQVLLYDIMGKPGKMLSVNTGGLTTTVDGKMLFYLALAFLLISSVAYIAHIFIATRFMRAKLGSLVSGLENVGKSGDLSYRIKLEGNDGLNWMADNVNYMLDSLQEHEGKYRSLFEQSNDAILIFDSDGYILDANGQASELLGYESSILHEHNFSSLSLEGYSPSTQEIQEETFREGSFSSETKLELSNGYVVDADVSSSLIDNEKVIFQAIIRDITERKRSEKALLDAKLAAEVASRTKSEFISIMSHELRTPLTSIIGFSDILLEGMTGDLNEKQDAYLKNISSSGKCLLDIINNILDISKIESEGVELDLEIFNVSEVLEDIKNIIMPLTAKKDLSLNIHNDSKLSVITADRQVFKQIIYNLISNAIKFTPEGGNIDVSVELRDNMAQFSVKDNGSGIAKEDYDSIFQAFTQLDSSHNRFYGGTGLGLFLVKKFVEMHGGKVWLESEMGNGSTFYFELPISGEQKIV